LADSPLTFELAEPRDDHARTVMEWRNDAQTLAMSFHHQPKVWDTFRLEYQRDYFRAPELPPLFALSGGERVAFLRFRPVVHPRDPALRCCDISINVAPAVRGRGLGTAVLVAARRRMEESGYDDLLAEVRVENEASRRAFVAAGFHEVDTIAKTVDTGERCSVVRFLAPLNAGFRSSRVFVIAEAGSNWRMGAPARDMKMARALIDVAADAGADAVKFQTYRPETVYVANAGGSDYLAAAGVKEDIRDIFADLAMPYEMIPELAGYCRERSVEFMSTPFSTRDFDEIDPHVRIHKCASYENGHLRLLQRFARSGKPLLMSTGASNEEDIEWAVETYRSNGGSQLCLLQCTARYPAPLEALNLSVIPHLKRRFGVTVGLSDHSREAVFGPIAAVALGARVIEKHYTLHPSLPGPDHAFAVSPDGLRAMIEGIRAAEKVVGSGIKEVLPAEDELRAYARRGIQAVRAIVKGEPLKEGTNIDILRPGKQRVGLHPKNLPRIEGRPAARDIPLGDGINEGDWIE
jgi:sialic acid synthase SpsE/ribosomal protein S18 acetylase RimI-like enzyme